jgi:hypothetical protein
MPFIIYPQQNGQVAVIIPAGDIQQAIKDVPIGLPHKIVDSLNIDNDYFNAFDFNEEIGIKFNIKNGKAIHLDKFRAARIPLLNKLDIEFMKAIETGDFEKQAEIALKKQALRDVTQTEIAGNTPEEIKAVWPSVLN